MNKEVMVILFLYGLFIIRLQHEMFKMNVLFKSFKTGMFKWMEMQEKMNPERFNAELHKVLEELKGENK